MEMEYILSDRAREEVRVVESNYHGRDFLELVVDRVARAVRRCCSQFQERPENPREVEVGATVGKRIRREEAREVDREELLDVADCGKDLFREGTFFFG